MSHAENANPLIHPDQASTLDALCKHLEWMVIQKNLDPQAHPGEVYQLQMALGATRFVRCGNLHN